jgi:tRNA wybutosine-synthesizing protein 4
MVRNLEVRGCPLRGLDECPTLRAQESRFEATGWKSRPARDMNSVFDGLPAAELARVRKLEIFDEVEEWQLISSHYCIATAYKDSKGLGLNAMPV